MDELTRNLELVEAITASDAMNIARVALEDAAEDMDPERWAGIKEYVFPVLAVEGARLNDECCRLRGDA